MGNRGGDEGLRVGARDLVGVERFFFVWMVVGRGSSVDTEGFRGRYGGGVVAGGGEEESLLSAKEVFLHFDDAELGPSRYPTGDDS